MQVEQLKKYVAPPADIARYLYWVQGRRLLSPERPEQVRAIARRIAAVQWAASRGRRVLLDDELSRTFPERSPAEREAIARRSYDLQAQCLVEELLIGALTADNIGNFIVWEGKERLDAALSGKGALYMLPHAGNFMFAIALAALSGYRYTQLAARGFPPPERQILAEVRPSWYNVRAREIRDAAEDRLPARFLDMEKGLPVRQLVRNLADNGVVGIGWDGRGGTKFRLARWLGRDALLATGPYRLAATTGAAVVGIAPIRHADGRHRAVVLEPVVPDMSLPFQERCQRVQDAFLAGMEAVYRAHPDHYARWLLHCRVRVAMDDHPLFVDVAPDDRWKVYEGAEF